MAWVYPLTPNPQQACHGISIRQSLGDKGFPTPDPNFGKAVLKVKNSFARVQNSRVRGTTGQGVNPVFRTTKKYVPLNR